MGFEQYLESLEIFGTNLFLNWRYREKKELGLTLCLRDAPSDIRGGHGSFFFFLFFFFFFFFFFFSFFFFWKKKTLHLQPTVKAKKKKLHEPDE